MNSRERGKGRGGPHRVPSCSTDVPIGSCVYPFAATFFCVQNPHAPSLPFSPRHTRFCWTIFWINLNTNQIPSCLPRHPCSLILVKGIFSLKLLRFGRHFSPHCCCGEPFVLMCCEETLWWHSKIKPCLTLVLFPTCESELSRAIIVLLYSVAYTPFWHQRHTVRCNYEEVWIIDAWTVGCRNYMSTKNNDDHYPVLRWESSARWQSAHLCRF